MSTQLVILAAIFVAGGCYLSPTNPSLAQLLILGGLGVGGVGYGAKHREAGKAKAQAVDLEKTATNLRRELFEATSSTQQRQP